MVRKEYFISIVIFLVIIILLIGCFHKQERNYVESFYASGALKSKKWFWQSGIFVDTAFYYYENGKISSIDILNDSGLLHGISKIFYEDGKLYQSIPYNNGVTEGFVCEYSNKGNLFSKVYYKDNTQMGDCYWFYDNSAQKIKQYSFIDFTGHNLNLISYDSITGNSVKNMYQDIFIDSVIFNRDAKNDSFSIQLLISNPPHRRSIVSINYLSKVGRILKSDMVSGVPYFLINQRMPDSLYVINFEGSQFDSLSNITLSQTENKIITLRQY